MSDAPKLELTILHVKTWPFGATEPKPGVYAGIAHWGMIAPGNDEGAAVLLLENCLLHEIASNKKMSDYRGRAEEFLAAKALEVMYDSVKRATCNRSVVADFAVPTPPVTCQCSGCNGALCDDGANAEGTSRFLMCMSCKCVFAVPVRGSHR